MIFFKTDMAIENAGQMAFAATVSGEAASSNLWSDGSGVLKLIERNTGVDPTADDHFLAFKNPAMNDLGNIVFSAQISGPCDWSIRMQKEGALDQVARQLDGAPGTIDPNLIHDNGFEAKTPPNG